MLESRWKNWLVVSVVLSLWFGFRFDNEVHSQESNRERIEYSNAAEDVLIELYQGHDLLEPDSKPRVSVYGSGRVVVFFPPLMKRAGTYEHFLTTDELEELLGLFLKHGVYSFDKRKAKAEIREAKDEDSANALRFGTEIQARSDESTTTLRINLSSYTPAGENVVTKSGFTKEIYWRGLKYEARKYPNVKTVVNLAKAESLLAAYTDHPDLKKIKVQN